MIRNNNNGDKG